MCDSGPDAAADWLFPRWRSGRLRGGIAREKTNEKAHDRKHRRGNGDEIGRAHPANEIFSDVSADDGAECPSDGDESVETFALFNREQVGHKRPENRGIEQIENADPDVKGAAGPHLLGWGTGSHQHEKEIGR